MSSTQGYPLELTPYVDRAGKRQQHKLATCCQVGCRGSAAKEREGPKASAADRQIQTWLLQAVAMRLSAGLPAPHAHSCSALACLPAPYRPSVKAELAEQ